MNDDVRFHFGWDNSAISHTLLMLRGDDKGREVAVVRFETRPRGSIVPLESRVEVSSAAGLDLAQQLWDAGFRPREAMNHEGEIKHLRSEIDFLRSLVQTSDIQRRRDDR